MHANQEVLADFYRNPGRIRRRQNAYGSRRAYPIGAGSHVAKVQRNFEVRFSLVVLNGMRVKQPRFEIHFLVASGQPKVGEESVLPIVAI